MEFTCIKVDSDKVKISAKELYSSKIPPFVASLSLITGYHLGETDQYLTSIFNSEDVNHLENGNAIAIFCPTGAGKTIASEQAAISATTDRMVIFLTNRISCKSQLIQDFGKLYDICNIPENLINNIQFSSNLKIMTYQQFALQRYHYQHKEIVLFLDECHCLSEDSTFSVYPQQIVSYLHNNLNNTIRIYMTATPDAVLPLLWEIEARTEEDKKLYPLIPDNLEKFIKNMPTKESTRIQHTYLMKSNWNYITFRIYHPENKEQLLAFIKNVSLDDKKSLIYINNIQEGKALQEQLGESQHIYSNEDKKSEIYQIATDERFSSDYLITTKVAENGLSLHDESLAIIVAETYHLITLQQIIGRARVSRKNPHEIIVLIPDYNLSQLGSIYGTLCTQIRRFHEAHKEPHFAMAKYQEPYVYYDPILQTPLVNEIGRQELQRQIDFIQSLREEEEEHPHAFVRHVLETYGKSTDNIDELFIDYDSKKECIDRIHTAWENFKASQRTDADLSILKEALKSACNETGAYGKELKSNIQIDTINKVLAFAGFKDRLQSGRTVFGINSADENN